MPLLPIIPLIVALAVALTGGSAWGWFDWIVLGVVVGIPVLGLIYIKFFYD